MVRTRHSGDHEDEFPRKFISLDHEKTRGISYNGQRLTSHVQGTSNSDDAGVDSMNMFEDKLVESRLRPRTGPRRAYNYLDADSSDDEIQMRIRQISPRRFDGRLARSRNIKEEMMEEEQQRFRKSTRRSHPVKVDTEDSGATISTRRSMRQKRLIHDTLNQSLLVNNDREEKSHLSANKERKNDSDDEGNEHDSDDDGKEQETEDNLEFSDMYSRVKRKRVSVKRNMYGMPVNDMDSDSDQDETNCNSNAQRTNNTTDDDEDDEDEDGKENESSVVSTRRGKQDRNLRKRPPQQTVKSYSLREHKPRTVLYKAPVEEKRHRKIHHGIFDVTPTKKTNNQTYQSPALRRKVMKRSAFHGSSSSTSSSDNENNDEKRFKRRNAKSMAKARSRMMPMNYSTTSPTSSIIKDRVKSGCSLADVEPMNIDKNISFKSIGGLENHIKALKEMIVFPLMYEKAFQAFKVDPPRGVLFYGPPGTGKTLVARALANVCSRDDKRIAFFMRKGADCLSKWVGESERQLRLLFDQAYKFRPSIIFFDEIDGLAPVRSSRQDQIHSSIVSTLLALMDGLDSREEIVVIGATNRIDSLDPALRRPGRFDREFLFPLPSLEARKQILKIHTDSWTPKLNDSFIGELAEKCVGYCGADLKALCTEAAMCALRRRYPQIYVSDEALEIDESSINISAKDFFHAINNIIPTSQRACDAPAKALPHHVFPLQQRQHDKVMNQLSRRFPSCLSKLSSSDVAATSSQELVEAGNALDELSSDDDVDAPSIFVSPHAKGSKSKDLLGTVEGPSTSHTSGTFFNFTRHAARRPATFRPRILLAGEPGQGQTIYVAPSVLHKMEDLPVHVLDFPTLYAVTAKAPEESCANVFHEAKRKTPSIIYMPYINQWWGVMGDTLRTTLLTLIHDLNPSMPLLLLATSEQLYEDLDPTLQSLFRQNSGEVVTMTNPNFDERRIFFEDLLLHQSCKAPPKKKAGQKLEVLKKRKRSKLRGCCLPRQSLCRSVRCYADQKKTKCSLKPSVTRNGHSVKCITSTADRRTACKKVCSPVKHHVSNSSHPMVLRRRGNFSKLNKNLSARPNRETRSCCILKSKKSRIVDSMRSFKNAVYKEICNPVIEHVSNSIHSMVLRPREIFSKLNRNHSARQNREYRSCCVLKSNKSRFEYSTRSLKTSACKEISKPVIEGVSNSVHPMVLRSQGYFSKLNRNHSAKQNRDSSSCILKSSIEDSMRSFNKLFVRQDMRLSETLSRKFQSYSSPAVRNQYQLVVKLEEAAGPSGQSNMCNSDPSTYSDILNKYICDTNHRLQRDVDHGMLKRMSKISKSVFPCGSAQMLYKQKDKIPELKRCEIPLPINFGDLRACRISAGHHQRLSPKLVNYQKLRFSSPPRTGYSLRPRSKKPSSNHDVVRAQRMLEVLPKAPRAKPRELTEEELKQLTEKEELTLMELRIFLRDVLNKLGSDRKFSIFAKPVNIEDAPDYHDIIETPMDLSTMMSKIDLHGYTTVGSFMKDIDLICHNALEYNPNRGTMDRIIRHRACALKDTAYAIIKTELDKDFEQMCLEIEESRKRRENKDNSCYHPFLPHLTHVYVSVSELQKESNALKNLSSQPSVKSSTSDARETTPINYLQRKKEGVGFLLKNTRANYVQALLGVKSTTVPNFYYTKPVSRVSQETSKMQPTIPSYLHQNRPPRSIPKPEGERFSRRVRGLNTDPGPSLEDVERISRMARASNSPMEESNQNDLYKSEETEKCIKTKDNSVSTDNKAQFSKPASKSCDSDAGKSTSSDSKGLSRKKTTKCIWCKPRRKRRRLVFPKAVTCKMSEEDADGGISQEDEDEELEDSENPVSSFHQTLKVDVSDNLAETEELTSPPRKSSRINGPVNFPVGIVTRRQSLSPRIGQTSQKKNSDKKCKSSVTEAEQHEVDDTNAKPLEAQPGSDSSLPKECSLIVSYDQDNSLNALNKRLSDALLQESCNEKRSVVKRLDLDAATIDSGAGSSLESNGDSRDSTDHKLEKNATSRINSETADMSNNCNLLLAKQAASLFNEQSKILEVPKERLKTLLTHLVHRTDGYNVEHLEEIYSCLSGIIYRHRHSYNRTNMVQELEEKVDNLHVF